MTVGLRAVDYLAVCVRKEIEHNELERSLFITHKAIKRYIKQSDRDVQKLIIESLLFRNMFSDYWIGHLSGINAYLERRLKNKFFLQVTVRGNPKKL
jgi:hypothetical protein